MSWTPFLTTGLHWAFILCFAYLLTIYAVTLALIVVSVAENGLRRREGHAEDYEVLTTSRFTIPVSIVAPAYNEAVIILPVVRSLLDLEYPEFEVILVNDGSTDGTLELLKSAFALEPREVFYRRLLPCAEVRAVYRSASEPRITVVDKANGGKADALNCGMNLAKYRYVCCVDADTVYNRDALLKGMRLVMKDPANVLGVTSLIAVSRHPEVGELVEVEQREGVMAGGRAGVRALEDGRHVLDSNLLSTFPHLDYLRAFINNRLAWSRHDFMLCAIGAFMIWRRDVVHEVGGFSKDFSCEDIEITFRVHEKFLRDKRPFKVLSLPDTVGRTEGPDKPSRLISQRARWQRVILETVWHYRHLLGNPRYGSVGLIGTPNYVLSEALAPFFQVLSVVALILATLFGLLNWIEFLSIVGILAFGLGVSTNAALLLQDANFRYYRLRDIIRLILLAPLDILLYRPIIFYAQFKGAWGFFRGDKRWDRFERNSRPHHPPASALASEATAP